MQDSVIYLSKERLGDSIFGTINKERGETCLSFYFHLDMDNKKRNQYRIIIMEFASLWFSMKGNDNIKFMLDQFLSEKVHVYLY
jgi:hypothetical protein